MGGDEVSVECWNSSSAFTAAIADRTNKSVFIDLWGQFQVEASQPIVTAHKRVMLWTSDLTTPAFYRYLPQHDRPALGHGCEWRSKDFD
ncbi:Aste57867_16918 [Aphanomyces stellatus]|uniref:beta-N-acetylhexosaminidase n=1 Tax=Aphanomyces stellatus TaxID=120398 RepID=A0A485L6J4_9STRA|nr:hypothetical protein As57867_016860 [Aphanomyces stellatus]VFT93680.1 Aste57867_16918 [Aphanomyces stellatus]